MVNFLFFVFFIQAAIIAIIAIIVGLRSLFEWAMPNKVPDLARNPSSDLVKEMARVIRDFEHRAPELPPKHSAPDDELRH